MKQYRYEARVALKVTAPSWMTHDDISKVIQRTIKNVDSGDECIIEMNGADTVCDLSTRTLTFQPTQDQEIIEIIEVIKKTRWMGNIKMEGRTIECDPDTMMAIQGMLDLNEHRRRVNK